MSDAWAPKITADEFAAAFAASSRRPLDEILARREVQPCNCQDDDECRGWMMVSPAFFADELALWEAGDGPHPSKLSAEEWAAWLDRRPDA